MEIFKILKEEHEEAKMLLEKAEATSEDAIVRQDLASKIEQALLPHAKAEEKTLYKALKEDATTEEIADSSEDEHAEMEKHLAALLKADPLSEEWMACLRSLKESVMHHVQEEESKLFEAAQEALSDGELEELALRYKEKRDKQKKKAL